MKLKFSERVVDYFVQAIFIFISVFLAFWLSNYQADKEEIRITKKAKHTIIAELETNLTILKRNGEYHRLIYMYQKEFLNTNLDTMKYYDESMLPKVSRGFEKYLLSKNTLFLANDARINLDVNHIVAINRLSEQIIQTQKVADEFFNRNEKSIDKSIRYKYKNFYRLLSKLWLKEDSLIKEIETTLQNLK